MASIAQSLSESPGIEARLHLLSGELRDDESDVVLKLPGGPRGLEEVLHLLVALLLELLLLPLPVLEEILEL